MAAQLGLMLESQAERRDADRDDLHRRERAHKARQHQASIEDDSEDSEDSKAVCAATAVPAQSRALTKLTARPYVAVLRLLETCASSAVPDTHHTALQACFVSTRAARQLGRKASREGRARHGARLVLRRAHVALFLSQQERDAFGNRAGATPASLADPAAHQPRCFYEWLLSRVSLKPSRCEPPSRPATPGPLLSGGVAKEQPLAKVGSLSFDVRHGQCATRVDGRTLLLVVSQPRPARAQRLHRSLV